MANPVMRIIKENNPSAQQYVQPATLSGTINKSIGLIGLTIISAVAANYLLGDMAGLGIMAGCVCGFILAMITSFKPTIAEYTAPGYAIFEGIALGLISRQFEQLYFGISLIAVGVTFTILVLMLFLWKTGIISVTDKLRSAIISMTFAVVIFYLIGFVVSWFGINLIPSSGIIGLGVSLIICGIASMNLLLDFDNIEQCVNNGAPKYYEYFCAFGLLVTLVWLYVEILRLVSIIMSMMNNR